MLRLVDAIREVIVEASTVVFLDNTPDRLDRCCVIEGMMDSQIQSSRNCWLNLPADAVALLSGRYNTNPRRLIIISENESGPEDLTSLNGVFHSSEKLVKTGCVMCKSIVRKLDGMNIRVCITISGQRCTEHAFLER